MEFKRFSKDKQEQIKQFVAYAQMMGLTGKDIRSIGDKLDRQAKAELRKQNMEIIRGYECLPIGEDSKHRRHKNWFQKVLDGRFKLKTAIGTYRFDLQYGSSWRITSLKTKSKKNYHTASEDYELGVIDWSRRSRYALILDINAGKLKLDF